MKNSFSDQEHLFSSQLKYPAPKTLFTFVIHIMIYMNMHDPTVLFGKHLAQHRMSFFPQIVGYVIEKQWK